MRKRGREESVRGEEALGRGHTRPQEGGAGTRRKTSCPPMLVRQVNKDVTSYLAGSRTAFLLSETRWDLRRVEAASTCPSRESWLRLERTSRKRGGQKARNQLVRGTVHRIRGKRPVIGHGKDRRVTKIINGKTGPGNVRRSVDYRCCQQDNDRGKQK